MRLGALLLLLALHARPSGAQQPDSLRRAAGATISGRVRDSIARGPLAGAMVQLVSAERQSRSGRSTLADSLGRYRMDSVPDGHYMLGFFHPVLDSLGVEPPLREVTVVGGMPVLADLATPAPAQLRAAICGRAPSADLSAVVTGVVLDARTGAPLAGVTVTGEWLEFTFRRGWLDRRMPHVVATTGENGWYALCGVPNAGTVVLLASRAADSTDRLEVPVPSDGFAHHALFLGTTVATSTGDSVHVTAGSTTDSARTTSASVAPSRRVRTGSGRLTGTVVALVGGQPIAGAFVGLAEGPLTRAGERGEWTLTNLPVGSRMLEVRAVGYYPVRRRVDVLAGSAPVHVSLPTLRAILDTVRVTAARLHGRDISGFVERRRSSGGRFLTQDDIAARGVIVTSDLFNRIPGLRIEPDPDGLGKRLVMRDATLAGCSPAIYLDGQYMGGLPIPGVPEATLGADDIDAWIKPADIAGIEIYAQGTVPIEFQRGFRGCGSIVIWSK